MKTELVINNIVLDIEYDYTAEEAMVYNYGDGSGYPGYPDDLFDGLYLEYVKSLKKQNK